ncbi:hypothetical protein K439DRAFT_1623562 [Ramaria rubella]|nr:hypothetical protein K439DRAFT_1623562 [Ramaria rubella]
MHVKSLAHFEPLALPMFPTLHLLIPDSRARLVMSGTSFTRGRVLRKHTVNNHVEYAVKTTTGILCEHIKNHHAAEYIEVWEKHRWVIKIPSLVDPHDPSVDSHLAFTMAQFKSALVNWIVVDDQAKLLSDHDIPHRTAAIQSLIAHHHHAAHAWEVHFEEMKLELKKAAGKISLTSDGWDDKSMWAYITATAHYLARPVDANLPAVKGPLFL